VNGGIVPVLIWHAPLVPCRCDIVIDLEPNRVYDVETDGPDSGSPGFIVVANATIPGRCTSLSTHPARNHRSCWLAVCYRCEQDQKKVQLNHQAALADVRDYAPDRKPAVPPRVMPATRGRTLMSAETARSPPPGALTILQAAADGIEIG